LLLIPQNYIDNIIVVINAINVKLLTRLSEVRKKCETNIVIILDIITITIKIANTDK